MKLFFYALQPKSLVLRAFLIKRKERKLQYQWYHNFRSYLVEAGKKAALTRATGVYFVAEHLDKIEPKKRPLAEALREFICGLDESVEEAPKKHYIAYKVSQNFVCMEIHRAKILLFMKVDPGSIQLAENHRDVRNIGHYGTGDLEVSIHAEEDVENAKEFIQMAFNNIGGN